MIQGLFGFLVFLGLAWGVSENRGKIRWKTVIAGILFQWLLALLFLKFSLFKDFFITLNSLVLALEGATKAGTGFVFGYLGGGSLPFAEPFPGAAYILAFRGLPLVLVMSALSALLFHWRILPWVVRGFSKLLEKGLNIGGALGLGAAMNVFVGMVEAPLLIRPYLAKMTRGELFALMACGMSTIAGTMMVLYAAILEPVIPGALGHILTASIISAPAAITVAFLMVPDDGPPTSGHLVMPESTSSAMDAITRGTTQGVSLLIQILALLVVLVALVNLANQLLGLLPHLGESAITLQRLLGFIMAPVTWLMGIPWGESFQAGALMGTKTVLNEFIAYLDLAKLSDEALSPRSRLIMTYALCGFANLGSLGIMIGGMGEMAKERRGEIIELGFKSIVAGTLATCLTGAVVGVVAG
ncbi:MAG: nucleoside:proton symporter [Magnetococcales bacterium]|nr:nucleoside:proton symporter [Magnetococcales bacterium]